MLQKSLNDPNLLWIADRIGGCDLKNGPWIAGGVARRLWFDEPWKDADVDVFFPNIESFDYAKDCLKKRIVPENTNKILKPLLDFGSIVVDVLTCSSLDSRRKPDAVSVYESKNAITYKIRINKSHQNTCNVQIIRRDWHDSLTSVWKNFDLTACMFATDGKIVVADQQAVLDCKNKILRKNQQTTRNVKLSRVVKYSIYGFDAGADVMSDLLQQYKDGTISEVEGSEDYA